MTGVNEAWPIADEKGVEHLTLRGEGWVSNYWNVYLCEGDTPFVTRLRVLSHASLFFVVNLPPGGLPRPHRQRLCSLGRTQG